MHLDFVVSMSQKSEMNNFSEVLPFDDGKSCFYLSCIALLLVKEIFSMF